MLLYLGLARTYLGVKMGMLKKKRFSLQISFYPGLSRTPAFYYDKPKKFGTLEELKTELAIAKSRILEADRYNQICEVLAKDGDRYIDVS